MLAAILSTAPVKADSLEVRIGYVQWLPDQGPVLSNVLPEPEDAGLKGAELGMQDNSTTGKFLGQTYTLESRVADSEADFMAAFDQLRASGIELFVVNAPAQTLKRMTAKAGENTLLFNAGSRADELRTIECNANLLHTMPSYAMLTDALAQWLNQRRWNEIGRASCRERV